MASIIMRRKVKIQSGQLEWLILVMAGTVMAALQIMSCVFQAKEYMYGLLDWTFFMAGITLGGHFSFVNP